MDQDITEIIKLPAYSDAHNMSTTATEPHDIVMSDDSMLLDADINTQTFHFFCRLPKEVRRRIWALNLPGPRIVEVVSRGDEFYGAARTVVNLLVCQESRREALKTHPLSFCTMNNLPLVAFCFETDTLVLGRGFTAPLIFKRGCNPTELAKVKKLMVDSSIYWGVRLKDDRGWRLGRMSHAIFSGVEDYTCIFTDDTDPLPIWASDEWFPRLRHWQDRMPDYGSQVVMSYVHNYLPPHKERIKIGRWDCEQNRYGGLPYYYKREPAIKYWDIPKVFTLGMDRRIMEDFNQSRCSSWAELIMDRVIEDIFD